MRVTIIRRAGEAPLTIEAAVVVVEDHNGTPLSVAYAQGRPPTMAHIVAHARDREFSQVLQQLGLNKTVVCEELSLPGPPAGAQLWRPEGG